MYFDQIILTYQCLTHTFQNTFIHFHSLPFQSIKLNAHVPVPEYPGYGLCEGRPNETSVIAAAQRAYDFATQTLNVPPSKIVLYGRSIGSGPTLAVAAKVSSQGGVLGGVLLHSPFTSIKAVARTLVGRWSVLMLDRFLNARNITQLNPDTPVHLLHGEEDRLIPCDQSETLLSLCPSATKSLQILPRVDHNSFSERQILQFVGDFLKVAKISDTPLPKELATTTFADQNLPLKRALTPAQQLQQQQQEQEGEQDGAAASSSFLCGADSCLRGISKNDDNNNNNNNNNTDSDSTDKSPSWLSKLGRALAGSAATTFGASAAMIGATVDASQEAMAKARERKG